MIPANANALFLALLENSRIHNAMQYLFIDDVITRIQAYSGRQKYNPFLKKVCTFAAKYLGTQAW